MSMTTVRPVVRSLIEGLIDYAGLFPPAALSMQDVVSNFALYHNSSDAWALGRLVVPVGRLEEFVNVASAAVPGASPTPWRVSLLVVGPLDGKQIVLFNERWAGRMVIDALEGKATTPQDVVALAAAVPRGVALFVELAISDALDACLAAVQRAGASAKIRTGGVTPDAFPSASDVLRFMRACHEAGVAYKATAGLHHAVRGLYPLTYAPASPRAPMYGYLNMLMASAIVRAGRSDAEATRALLAESFADLSVTAAGVEWAGLTIPLTHADSVRAFFRGVGSCSFREPVDELAALGALAG